MEIIGAGFLFSLFWFIQKKERAKLFPAGLCAICKEPVHFTHNAYVHSATGEELAETVWIRYMDEHANPLPEGDGGAFYRNNFPVKFHHADIPSSPEEQAMYQS